MTRFREFLLTSRWAPWLLALAITSMLFGALLALEWFFGARVFGVW